MRLTARVKKQVFYMCLTTRVYGTVNASINPTLENYIKELITKEHNQFKFQD